VADLSVPAFAPFLQSQRVTLIVDSWVKMFSDGKGHSTYYMINKVVGMMSDRRRIKQRY